VFALTYEIADELERVGGEILGGVNKSKTFRVKAIHFKVQPADQTREARRVGK
jgi:hypothetical protein